MKEKVTELYPLSFDYNTILTFLSKAYLEW